MRVYALEDLESRFRAAADLEICVDSRRVVPGCVFVALPPTGVAAGSGPGGAAFIKDALARGAGFVVCRPEDLPLCPEEAVEQGVVPCADPHEALGRLAASRYGQLSFPLVGVTGTNGKTTCTWLLAHLFERAGRKTGLLGTVAYRWPGHDEDAPMTTPDCPDLHRFLGEMRRSGVDMAFMEVSSHALDQRRTAGLHFSGALFTNLTQDHLDYHHDMEAYFAAKARLFLEGCTRTAVRAVGSDNEWGARLIELAPGAFGYGLKARAGADYLHGEILSSGTSGLHLRMRRGGQSWELRSPLVGAFNAENLLAVQAVGLGFGLGPGELGALSDFTGVPGRLERIVNDRGLDIFVDYAHTPDALINVLSALRGAGFARIVTVFGCGGDRDRTKRPLMGEAVARLSDVAVLTSDNPRHEDPEAIMDEVMPGLAGAGQILRDADRRQALEKALNILKPGDALLVAGKGHERTQQIGDRKFPFSDQSILRELLGCA